MDIVDTPIIFRELALLPSDLTNLVESMDMQVNHLKNSENFKRYDEVFLIGSGDSHCAALSMSMLLQELEVRHTVFSSFEFIHYHKKQNANQKQLLIAISASGNSPIILEGLQCAREKEMSSLIITGNKNAKSMALASFSLCYTLQDKEVSPGIRSYQASMLSLAILSLALTEKTMDKDAFLKELFRLSPFLEDTIQHFTQTTEGLIAAVYKKPTFLFLGAGPNFGTAKYASAKVIEGTGIPAMAQELEEWWHIERFAAPYDMAVFIFAPGGKSFDRCLEIAEQASLLGRNVYLITNQKPALNSVKKLIYFKDPLREELTPFILGNFGSSLAGHVAMKHNITHFRKVIEP